eukprot:6491575-Amphidinium_carterae.1
MSGAFGLALELALCVTSFARTGGGTTCASCFVTMASQMLVTTVRWSLVYTSAVCSSDQRPKYLLASRGIPTVYARLAANTLRLGKENNCALVGVNPPRTKGDAWKVAKSGAGDGNKKSLCGSNDCNWFRACAYGVHHTY